MDNKNDVQDQELDLDQILNEFHENPPEETPDVEPDEELKQLLHLPELTITPVVVKEPDLAGLLKEEAPSADLSAQTRVLSTAAALQGDTVMFSAITDEQIAQAAAAAREAAALAEDATVAIPTVYAPTLSDDTIPLEDLSQIRQEAPEAAPAKAEPAFEVPEEFIPSPILFNPRSRLKELKKQLVAGPEKRYYELTEIGTGKLQLALILNFFIVIGCAVVTTMYAKEMLPENRLRLVIFSQVLAMMISALLGSHLMMDAVADLLKGRFTVNTLLTLTFAACMMDAVFCLKELRIPCCAAFSLEMNMALWSRLQRRNTEMAQMDTMRKAVRLHGIIKVENYYEGRDGLLRTEGEVDDFMETYNKMSSPELVQSIYAFLSLIACLGIAGFTGYLHGLSMGIRILSTSLLVAVPASFFVSITRPMSILENRLHMVGTVLCGWEGVKDLCGKAAFPLTDRDLFPQGSTKLNGVKFYGDREPDEIIAYSAALMHSAGGNLEQVFAQLCASRSCREYTAENVQSYPNGGIGGEVMGESVLLGTMSFLQDMGVEIPEGTMVNQAVYCSIDGTFSAVFAVTYNRMKSAAGGLVTICGYRKLYPVLLSKDFMLTESFLKSKFGIRTRRFTFPTLEERDALAAVEADPEAPVLALTTQDSLAASAYAVTGARALRTASKAGMVIHIIGSILGMLIMFALAYLGSVELLTPINILLYQLVWMAPGLLITEWTRTV